MMMELPAVIKTERNEYARRIRKAYDKHKIAARRCEMKHYTLREDGLCNTLTTLVKDNYIVCYNPIL